MSALNEIPVQIQAAGAAPLPDAGTLRRELESQIEGEVRFDTISRALYSTDASVYQIQPVGVVIPRNREDILRMPRDLPPLPLPHHHARRRHVAGRPGHRRRPAGRHLEVLQPHAGSERGRALGARRAGHRAGRTERATGAARPALRARHLHRQPRHHRRHDGQQFRRRAQRALRQNHRSRPGTDGRALRRQRRPLPRDSAQRSPHRRHAGSRLLPHRAAASRPSTPPKSTAATPRSCAASAATTSTSSPIRPSPSISPR